MQVRTGLPLANTAAHQKPAGLADVACFLTLECFLHVGWRAAWCGVLNGMAMEPKIAVLFILIASVVGLSHLSEEVLGRMRRQLGEGRWREILPRRRRV